jgi:hypothetical protein
MAAKQARLVYRMLKYGQEYVDKGTARYEEKYRLQRIRLITKQAAQQGFALVPLVSPVWFLERERLLRKDRRCR